MEVRDALSHGRTAVRLILRKGCGRILINKYFRRYSRARMNCLSHALTALAIVRVRYRGLVYALTANPRRYRASSVREVLLSLQLMKLLNVLRAQPRLRKEKVGASILGKMGLVWGLQEQLTAFRGKQAQHITLNAKIDLNEDLGQVVR